MSRGLKHAFTTEQQEGNTLNYYKVYGLVLEADLEISYLECATREECNKKDLVKIRRGSLSKLVLDSDNGTWKIGKEFSYLHNNTMRMEILAGKELHYEKKPEGKEEYLKAFILGYGLSMLCLQRNIITIHCSAIEHQGKAILISGESGSGKSTLTRRLLDRGFGFMADDIAAVLPAENAAMVQPTFPYQKLCRDGVENLVKPEAIEELIYIDEDKDKYLVPMKKAFVREAIPAKAMIYLYAYEGTTMRVHKLEGMDKLVHIAGNQFLRKLLGEDKYAPFIGAICLELAKNMEVYAIGRPKYAEAGEEMADFVENLARS